MIKSWSHEKKNKKGNGGSNEEMNEEINEAIQVNLVVVYFCVMTVMILFLFFSLTLIGLKNNCLISFVFDGNIKIQDGRDLHEHD